MGIIDIILLSVSLAMDAFAVSISNGLILPSVRKRDAATFGVFFGFFQFMMPMIGFFLGTGFSKYIVSIDHWIAFILLALIGGNMVKESFGSDEEESKDVDDILSFKNLTLLAIATSIDALAVGVTFAFITDINVIAGQSHLLNTVISCIIIGVITFVISYIGVIIGKKISGVFQSYAERIGGFVLIAIGLKILIQHLFFGG
jgi:putative Mn2+ efflux pump MntP